MSRQRWDPDLRGVGVADASAWLPVLHDLEERAGTPNWIAEEPEAHLLPHIQAAIDADGSGWSLEGWRIDGDGILVVDLARVGETESQRDLRVAAFALVGTVAESATAIYERQTPDGVELDVLTGMPPAETLFATHGHTLRLRIARMAHVAGATGD